MGVTAADRFWAKAQLDLIGLPRPWKVLAQLEQIDPELYARLVQGEGWLMRQTQLQKLEEGWRFWLRLYRCAVERLAQKESKAG